MLNDVSQDGRIPRDSMFSLWRDTYHGETTGCATKINYTTRPYERGMSVSGFENCFFFVWPLYCFVLQFTGSDFPLFCIN